MMGRGGRGQFVLASRSRRLDIGFNGLGMGALFLIPVLLHIYNDFDPYLEEQKRQPLNYEDMR